MSDYLLPASFITGSPINHSRGAGLQLCVQRGRGMLERSAEDCGGGCICGLPGNKCTQKVGGAVAGRSPTVGGYVGVLCYVGFLTVWCGSWDVVPVCVMCLCVC